MRRPSPDDFCEHNVSERAALSSGCDTPSDGWARCSGALNHTPECTLCTKTYTRVYTVHKTYTRVTTSYTKSYTRVYIVREHIRECTHQDAPPYLVQRMALLSTYFTGHSISISHHVLDHYCRKGSIGGRLSLGSLQKNFWLNVDQQNCSVWFTASSVLCKEWMHRLVQIAHCTCLIVFQTLLCISPYTRSHLPPIPHAFISKDFLWSHHQILLGK